MHAAKRLADLGSLSGAQLASAVAGPAEAQTEVLTANATAFPGKAGAPVGRGAACGRCLWLDTPAGRDDKVR